MLTVAIVAAVAFALGLALGRGVIASPGPRYPDLFHLVRGDLAEARAANAALKDRIHWLEKALRSAQAMLGALVTQAGGDLRLPRDYQDRPQPYYLTEDPSSRDIVLRARVPRSRGTHDAA